MYCQSEITSIVSIYLNTITQRIVIQENDVDDPDDRLILLQHFISFGIAFVLMRAVKWLVIHRSDTSLYKKKPRSDCITQNTRAMMVRRWLARLVLFSSLIKIQNIYKLLLLNFIVITESEWYKTDCIVETEVR